MDETGIQQNSAQKYVIAEKGRRSVYSIIPESRDHVTLVAYASADGHSGSPYFILPKVIQLPWFKFCWF